MDYLISHALRTLVKRGDEQALKFLGNGHNPKISVENFTVSTPTVKVGESLIFSFDIAAQKSENLMIDYIMYFKGKNGKSNQKVFKIKKCHVQEGAPISIQKKHPLRKMTTRILYPGKHSIALQINGKKYGKKIFSLVL